MRDLLAGNSVIPVIVLNREEDAVPLAKALVAGGLKVLEITLRTPAAVGGIRQIIEQVPEAIVGTGTVYTRNRFSYQKIWAASLWFLPAPLTNFWKQHRNHP